MTSIDRASIFGSIAGAILALLLGVATAHAVTDVRQDFHQTYPLDAQGRFALNNVNGPVKITGWDRNEVRIDAVKTAHSQECLDQIKINVDAHLSSVEVRTEYPKGKSGCNSEVAYTISVPRAAHLDEVNVVNGSLTVEDVSGDLHAESVNGRLYASGMTGRVDLSTVNGELAAVVKTALKDIHLESVNGRIDLTIPSDVSAEVSAETVNGRISNDYALAVQRGPYVGSHFPGQLAKGGPALKLETVNGASEIHHANDGKQLSSATSLLPQRAGRFD